MFRDYGRGISLGCPLSPLMGAFFLKRLDERMERSGLFYVRFMDDNLVLAPTRWRLRKAVKAVLTGEAPPRRSPKPPLPRTNSMADPMMRRFIVGSRRGSSASQKRIAAPGKRA